MSGSGRLGGLSAARARVLPAALGLLGAAAFGGTLVASALAARGDTALMSRQSRAAGGAGADGVAEAPSISREGRFVAFETQATNLGGPIQAPINVYVYDARRKRVRLISRQGGGGTGSNGDSTAPAISADGRFVAFESDANNLGGPAQGVQNIYLYDRERKRVRLVSRQGKRHGGAGADDDSSKPSVSADGRFVSFTTTADNLGGPIDPSVANCYVFDRVSKRTRLVSRQGKRQGGAAGNDTCFGTAISRSGRFVAMRTAATNLGGPIDDEATGNAYVYDRERKRMRLVSRQGRGAGGDGANEGVADPAISGNGRFVAFATSATNLGGPTQTDVNVYLYDRERKRVRLVSRESESAGGEGADSTSRAPTVSGSGRFVGFSTLASNLGGAVDSSVFNVYVYDRERRRVRLASRASAGGQGGNGDSEPAAIAASGRFVAFETEATNLGGQLGLAASNVYRHQLRR